MSTPRRSPVVARALTLHGDTPGDRVTGPRAPAGERRGLLDRCCVRCGEALPARARADAAFCGRRCRQAAFRLRRASTCSAEPSFAGSEIGRSPGVDPSRLERASVVDQGKSGRAAARLSVVELGAEVSRLERAAVARRGLEPSPRDRLAVVDASLCDVDTDVDASQRRRRVVALYIDPRGPYPELIGNANCWDETRDALTYEGEQPIVAHPDCGPWGALWRRYKGGNHRHAPRAVEQVRRTGGVIEHPAHSMLWRHQGLPLPGKGTDRFGGWTEEVEQCHWGHVAKKPTWLYCVRVDRALASARPAEREPTHWVTEPFWNKGRDRRPVCSAEQRRRTPVWFAAWLVALAESVEESW